eukprot:208276-Pleurochrysis_carterae.AAC.12
MVAAAVVWAMAVAANLLRKTSGLPCEVSVYNRLNASDVSCCRRLAWSKLALVRAQVRVLEYLGARARYVPVVALCCVHVHATLSAQPILTCETAGRRTSQRSRGRVGTPCSSHWAHHLHGAIPRLIGGSELKPEMTTSQEKARGKGNERCTKRRARFRRANVAVER